MALTGTFGATGQSSSFVPSVSRAFNVSVYGTFSAAVQLERSFDDTTWLPLTVGTTQLYTWSSAGGSEVKYSEIAAEIESGVSYRLNCTAYTSGTINYRVSQ